MAARSSGIFPREGFNLDSQLEITTSTRGFNQHGVTLASAKTIRLTAVGLTSGANDATATVTIGGETVVLDQADADPNGVVIAHIRGTLCDANNDVIYVLGGTSTPVCGGVFFELVDGPRR
jgi:hypothetical protein